MVGVVVSLKCTSDASISTTLPVCATVTVELHFKLVNMNLSTKHFFKCCTVVLGNVKNVYHDYCHP